MTNLVLDREIFLTPLTSVQFWSLSRVLLILLRLLNESYDAAYSRPLIDTNFAYADVFELEKGVRESQD